MRIAVRVDASSQIGTGHVMRCLTLANALRKHGAQLRFVSRHMPFGLSEMLEQNGHEFARNLSSPAAALLDGLSHSHWLGTSQLADGRDSVHALSDHAWDWLVVDHYALDARWEDLLKAAVGRILVIDDLADRSHVCDLLLDQNFYTDMGIRYLGKVPPECRLLLGPQYALLREEFRRVRARVMPRTGPVRRVLVFFGGTDPDNYTANAIEALASLRMADIHVNVVVGLQHPVLEGLQAMCLDHGFTCHVQTSQMADLMAAADLSVGACGSAIWERCAVGLPCIVLVLADNQRKAAADLGAAGVVVNLGDASRVSVKALAEHIRRLIADAGKRADLSRRAWDLVTPGESLRVVDLLVGQNA